MFGFLLALFLIGLVAGFLGRLFVPREGPMSFWQTVGIGIAGSFIGGFIGWLIFGKDLDEGALQPSGIIGSLVGTILLLLVLRGVRGRHAVSR